MTRPQSRKSDPLNLERGLQRVAQAIQFFGYLMLAIGAWMAVNRLAVDGVSEMESAAWSFGIPAVAGGAALAVAWIVRGFASPRS